MKNNNRAIVFCLVFVILVVVRCCLNENEQLVRIVGAINLVALLIVIFSLISQTNDLLSAKIKQTNALDDIIAREKSRIKSKMNVSVFIILLSSYSVYLFFFVSELGNDLISIGTLFLSLSDKSIADIISSKLFDSIWGR